MQRLSNATLGNIAPDVEIPRYDRQRVSAGIVHIGVGAFHRAHQAVLIDDCLARGEMEWGILGASLRSARTEAALMPQDGLYAVATRSTDGETLRIVGAIGTILVAKDDPRRLLAALAHPRIRLVTLTITEKGYMADLSSGVLRADHPDIRHDLANPSRPVSALGYIAEAVARRRESNVPPFAVLSCDNIPSNGRLLRGLLTEFATARDPELGRYVAEEVACPASMVDRIVPATRDADRAAVSQRIGAIDAWPVVTEPFFQWVVEDRFPAGRPRLEASGVEFVDDVEPFERMKLRLLNGAHTSIAAIGRLAGHATVADAVGDPVIRRFVQFYWEEVLPTLDLAPSTAREYARRLMSRFDNSALPHSLAQIAKDASQKLPQRIVAPLLARLRAGKEARAMTFAVAAWMRSCAGLSDEGGPFEVDDPRLSSQLEEIQGITAPGEVVSAFLRLPELFGPDLPRNAEFARDVTSAYTAIANKGVRSALQLEFP